MHQKILFNIYNKEGEVVGREVRLPKIIKNVSAFEMQFGFKQPTVVAHNRTKGIEEKQLIYEKYY